VFVCVWVEEEEEVAVGEKSEEQRLVYKHEYEERYGLHTWQAMAIESGVGRNIISKILCFFWS
jgi:hypothetical protein